MNVIIGFTNLIEKTTLSEEQHQYLNFIKTAVKTCWTSSTIFLIFQK
ncbi:hypothetical protein OCK74_09045 [Chitinophagaceae bacterium LB-8]|uniref:Uncharacterized protein n=2 Tax=Paraflavisolibacter caeni TaxID=2982496 RepID=A0A9X3B868_9BACT|nr:hypothetical protein [Paraflavisolibacter caeni]MCU7549261.1 hypothetical protein [Paraflavisolibacter caeni]